MDLAQAKTFFAQFDKETRIALAEAAAADMTDCTEKLIAAWQAGDVEGQRRARHSLKGLCENFGAHTLLSYGERELSNPDDAATMREYLALTLTMLRTVGQN